MKLTDYLNQNYRGRKAEFAARVPVACQYLSQIASGFRLPSERVSIQIEMASGGEVKKEELRPDVDWSLYREYVEFHNQRNAG